MLCVMHCITDRRFSKAFEPIRQTKDQPIFRLDEHLKRLFDSCKMYRIECPFSYDEIKTACCDVIRKNDLQSAYIRPIVYRDAAGLGLAPNSEHPIGASVMAFEWAPLLGAEAIENGSDVCVSSWTRLNSSTNPVLSKAGGHYLSSQLIAMEARSNGFDEGIAVNETGSLTEGAGANVFVLHKGKLLTPGLGISILEGITRDTVFHLSKYLGMELVECEIPRELLYCADELFLCGTAAEVTPIRSLDRIQIGDGKPGPFTRALQKQFYRVVSGELELGQNWLTHVHTAANTNCEAAVNLTTASMAESAPAQE